MQRADENTEATMRQEARATLAQYPLATVDVALANWSHARLRPSTPGEAARMVEIFAQEQAHAVPQQGRGWRSRWRLW
jgi:hypothetical protein